MKKIYLPDSNDRLFCYNVEYNEDLINMHINSMINELGETQDIKDIISVFEKDKRDYLPGIDDITRVAEYYKNNLLVGKFYGDFIHDRFSGSRLVLGKLSEYYDTEYEDSILNILSVINFEKEHNISLNSLRESIEQNIRVGYEFFKNGSLKYSVKDYQEIILSQVDRLFTEYRDDAIDNSKVLTLAYIKNKNKKK